MKLTNCVPLIEIPPVGIRPTSMLRTPIALNMGCAHVGWAGVTEAPDRLSVTLRLTDDIDVSRGDVIALALATDEAAAWIDVATLTPEDDAAIADWLGDADRAFDDALSVVVRGIVASARPSAS